MGLTVLLRRLVGSLAPLNCNIYKRKVELILCDCFKTFLEERVMKRLKDRLGLEIRSFPPHLHWWNKAEGVIRIMKSTSPRIHCLVRGPWGLAPVVATASFPLINLPNFILASLS